MKKSLLTLPIILTLGLTLSGCNSLGLMRNTPGFFKPKASKLKLHGKYGINYRYPNLKHHGDETKQLNALKRQYPIAKNLNHKGSAQQLLINLYQTAPMFPSQVHHQIKHLFKKGVLNKHQLNNYEYAARHVRPNVNQLALARLSLENRIKHLHITQKDVHNTAKTALKDANLTKREINHVADEYLK